MSFILMHFATYGTGRPCILFISVLIFREVEEISAGNIAVLSGLKLATTGDTILDPSLRNKVA